MRNAYIIIGQGVRLSRQIDELREVVDNNDIPFVTTKMAIDILPDHPMNMGMMGVRGNTKIPDDVDLVIAFGTSMSTMTAGYNGNDLIPKNARIAFVDYASDILQHI